MSTTYSVTLMGYPVYFGSDQPPPKVSEIGTASITVTDNGDGTAAVELSVTGGTTSGFDMTVTAALTGNIKNSWYEVFRTVNVYQYSDPNLENGVPTFLTYLLLLESETTFNNKTTGSITGYVYFTQKFNYYAAKVDSSF